jgi:hypothetical protein
VKLSEVIGDTDAPPKRLKLSDVTGESTPATKPSEPPPTMLQYDAMGNPTGFDIPSEEVKLAREGAKMPYGEQMGTLAERILVEAPVSAIAGTIGMPRDLYETGKGIVGKVPYGDTVYDALSVFNPLARVAKHMPSSGTIENTVLGEAEPGSGKQWFRTAGELLAPVPGTGAISVGKKAASGVRNIAEAVKGTKALEAAEALRSDIRSTAEGVIAKEKAKEAEATSAKARESLKFEQQTASQQAAEKVLADLQSASQQKFRSAVGLPEPEGRAAIESQSHVDAKLRNLAVEKLSEAEALQREVGGAAFEKYKEVANAKQSIEPFGASSEGRSLEAKLDEIIKGGKKRGLLTSSTEEMNRATKIYNELFREGGAHVDFKLVDDELQELRHIQAGMTMEKLPPGQRKRVERLADKIERALKSWVGEENYPRNTYAKASEPKNQFQSKLGEALTSREEIPYTFEEGGFAKTESQAANLVFSSRTNMQMAKQLLGEKEVNALAEQRAANAIAGLNAKQARKWIDNPKNAFMDEVPGLPSKLSKYVELVEKAETLTDQMKASVKYMTGENAKTQQGIASLASDLAKTERNRRAYEQISDKLASVNDFKDILPEAERLADRLQTQGLLTREEYQTTIKEIRTAEKQIKDNEGLKSKISKILGYALGTEMYVHGLSAVRRRFF